MVSEQFYCSIFLVGPKAFNFLFIFFFLIQSVRLSVVSFHSLHSTCATYCMLCCSSGIISFPIVFPGGQRTSPEVSSILNICLCPHTQFTCCQKSILGKFHLCVMSVTENYIRLVLPSN